MTVINILKAPQGSAEAAEPTAGGRGAAAVGLPIPVGRRVELPGRGTTFVREVDGPPGAPALVLIHGWIASAGINWYQLFEPASRHFRVIAPDLRGHGRGIRSRRRFRLADCADDIAVLLDELEVPSAIMVGYSMGGPVAQLLWKRHRSKVDGLVLCATSHRFVPGMRERLVFTTLMATAAGTSRAGQLFTVLPRSVVRQFAPVTAKGRPTSLQRWAAAEIRRHDLRMVLEAGHAIGHYDASRWIGNIDVPTAVVVTTKDRALTPAEQARLAFAIPHATIHRIEDGHVACTSPAFAAPVLAACTEVAVKAYPGWHPNRRVDDVAVGVGTSER
ncbi:MAG: alpha/beta hydrolase [Acidimicrobiales bacterium]|nr:alpha/beta hydrolase [Acidimicrobiales bacterium]